jgi:hypothetical protein
MNCDNSTQPQQELLAFMAAGRPGGEIYFDSAVVPYKRLAKYLIKLDVIKFDGTVFELNDVIQVALYREDDVWYCEEEKFSTLAFGDTAEEAVHSFCEDFAVLWEEIALAPDDSLTQEAQKVKQNLLAAVRSAKVG